MKNVPFTFKCELTHTPKVVKCRIMLVEGNPTEYEYELFALPDEKYNGDDFERASAVQQHRAATLVGRAFADMFGRYAALEKLRKAEEARLNAAWLAGLPGT